MTTPADGELVEALKRRHDFDDWSGSCETEEQLLVWRFFLSGEELSGWAAEQIRELSVPGWPPAVHSVWTRGRHDRLLLDVFECPSRVAAHELTVQGLAQFESALVERAEIQLGDIAFAAPGQAAILFARANAVLLIRHVTRDPGPIPDAARELDRLLASKPSSVEPKRVPALRRFEATGAALGSGQPAALDIEMPDPGQPRVWFKFFSPTGEIDADEERVLYRHVAAQPPEITAYSISPTDGAAERALRVM